MPTVLVLGATGYLGLPFTQSLLRSGNYTVYGLARSPGKAKTLTANEIVPFIGDLSDLDKIAHLITSVPIDIVVDTTFPNESAAPLLDTLVAVSEGRIQTLRKEGHSAPKLGFVYVSGTWIHGSPATPVSDLHPAGSTLSKSPPATLVAWRPAHEQAILAARSALDVAIVRPSLVYGRSGWIWSEWWSPLLSAKTKQIAATENETETETGIEQAVVEIPTDPRSRAAVVHVDDVASGMHAVTDRVLGMLGSWPVFDLVGETVSVKKVVEAARDVLGVQARLEFVGSRNEFLEAMNGIANHDRSSRANIVLGWEPKRRDFLRNLPMYVKAWEAAQYV